MADSISVSVSTADVKAMLKKVTPDLTAEVKTTAAAIGAMLAPKVRAGMASSRQHQQQLLAQTVTVVNDRVVSLKVGGKTSLTRKDPKRVGKKTGINWITFATEFGRKRSDHGFLPWNRSGSGALSYGFLSTVDANKPEVQQMWLDAVGKIVEQANKP